MISVRSFHHALWPERPYRIDVFELCLEFWSDRPPESPQIVRVGPQVTVSGIY